MIPRRRLPASTTNTDSNHPIQPPGFLTRAAMRIASTRFGGWVFTTFTPPIDKACLKLSGGRRSLAGLGAPTLLLTTIGRRSGLPRQTPLLYLPRGADQLAIIGSRGGRTGHAAWYLNIQANANVQVTLNGHTQRYTAEILSGDAYQALWEDFVAFNPGFVRYQKRLDRTIPLLILTPVQE